VTFSAKHHVGRHRVSRAQRMAIPRFFIGDGVLCEIGDGVLC
jgi:hypothetical protein